MLLILTLTALLCADQATALLQNPANQNKPSAEASPPALSTLAGTWMTVDAEERRSDPRAARALSQVIVTITGNKVVVHVEGFKAAAAKAFAPDVSTKVTSATAALVVELQGRMFVLKPTGGSRATLEVYSTFDDGSGRSDYMKVYNLRKN